MNIFIFFLTYTTSVIVCNGEDTLTDCIAI